MALTIVLAVLVAALIGRIIWYIYKKNDADETAIEVPDSFLELIDRTIWGLKHNTNVSICISGNYYKIIFYYDDFPTQTVVRVLPEHYRIEISKKQLNNEKYTEQFLFFLLIWAYFIIQIFEKKQIFDQLSITLAADEIALDYYLLNRKPVKELLQGLTELFSSAPSELNEERMRRIRKRIAL